MGASWPCRVVRKQSSLGWAGAFTPQCIRRSSSLSSWEEATLHPQIHQPRSTHVKGKKYSQTDRIASSNTVLSPFWVNAEHSKYFTAPISLDIARPCWYAIGAIRLNHKQHQHNRINIQNAQDAPLPELLNSRWVLAQIQLGSDKHERRRGRVMRDLGPPLQITNPTTIIQISNPNNVPKTTRDVPWSGRSQSSAGSQARSRSKTRRSGGTTMAGDDRSPLVRPYPKAQERWFSHQP